ncbi:MAG: PKD domain-containing protein [Bacteroidota bacterium]|nr:PKD domain-containing protein [Bacteroidota bacterium]
MKTLHSLYARGFWLTNRSDYIIIENCEIDITSSTSTSSGYSAGIAMVGSSTSVTSYTTGGIKGLYNTFRNNEIYGSTSNNGLYSGIAVNGTSSMEEHFLRIEGNYIHNFYRNGIYMYYNLQNTDYINNTIIRGQKSGYSTFYGIYTYYCNGAKFHDNLIADDGPSGMSYSCYGINENSYTTDGSSPHEYYNNIIHLNSGYYRNGIASFAYYSSSKKFKHNTVYMRGSYGYGYGIFNYEFYYADVEMKNNIVDVDFTSSPYFYNIYNYSYSNYDGDGNVLPVNAQSGSHYVGYLYTLNSGGGTALNWGQWLSNPNNPDPNGTDMRPTFVDPSTQDFEPTIIDLDGAGVAAGLTTDREGSSRSMTKPDPGAIEFDIDMNVTSINFPNVICQGSTDDVEVTIKNNSNLNLSNFWVIYEIDGVVQATEQFTNTINAGDSAQYTFTVPVNSVNTGGYLVTAYVRPKSPISNLNYNVYPAPVGSYISKGANYTGQFNSGNAQDPDIVAYGDLVEHVIEPPAGFSSTDYGTDWGFDFWEMVTPNGTSAGAQYSKTNPSGGNNAYNSFTPVIGQSDSTFLIRYAIVSLTNGCVAPSVERVVFVAPRPVTAFAATTACEGDAIQFTNNTTLSSGSIEYSWDFGDGSSSVLINPAHTYATHGQYTVTLTATSNYGYSDVAVVNVTVIENPTAEFGYTNVCEGAANPFVDGSIIPAGTPSYEWNFGDGNMGTGANPSHQYTTPGVYVVSMKVTANGCSDEATHYVTYAPRAVPDFTPSATSCNNDAVVFTNGSTLSSGNMGYSWNFGDNTTSTSTNPSHDYSIFGAIDVTLTVTTDYGCVDQITKQINLIEAPTASFTTGTICDKGDVDFTNTSIEPAGANTTYDWTFSDGSNYSSKDVTRGFNSIGMYQATLKAFSDNGCLDEMTVSFSVDEKPVAQFYAEAVCEGANTEFMNAATGNGGNFTNSWNFGTSGTSTDANPTAMLPVGNTDVTLTVTTPSGCESTITKTITVHANPTVNSIIVESGYQGDGTFTFTASVTPANAKYTIFWGDGGRSSGNASNGNIAEQYTYMIDGKYNVMARLENANCAITADGSAEVLRTGLINVVNGQLNVYPNPSNGIFNLDLSGLNTDNLQIEVYAANGQLIGAETLIQGAGAQVDLSNAAAGVYLVKVRTAEGVHTARITLNK